jgi:ubiquinol-cytochrome c reductase subunit 6
MVEDIKPELEKACHPGCAGFWKAYEACGERIKGDTTGEAHCSPQYFEYWKCVDKCVSLVLCGCLTLQVAPKLWAQLK